MESVFVLLVLWVMIICYFAWIISARSYSSLSNVLEFKLREIISPEELFIYRLSGNLALIEKDDFNHLKSSLSDEKIFQLLFDHWKIREREEFSVGLQQSFFQLGDTSDLEQQAFDAWNTGAACNTASYIRLFDVCKFLSVDAALVNASSIGPRQLNMTAWDIERTAYLVRLGYAANFIERDGAIQSLRRLSAVAREHYRSWEDFSISALIGMGTRSDVEVSQASIWHAYASTHLVMTSSALAPFDPGAGLATGVSQPRVADEWRERSADVRNGGDAACMTA